MHNEEIFKIDNQKVISLAYNHNIIGDQDHLEIMAEVLEIMRAKNQDKLKKKMMKKKH